MNNPHYAWAVHPGDVGTPVAIPEPSTLALLGIGAIAFLAYAWRRRRRR